MKKSDFDKYAGKENVLLIMNHTYELDWLVGWVWCDFCGVLGVSLKASCLVQFKISGKQFFFFFFYCKTYSNEMIFCRQNCKTFAKKSVQYIPTLGFAWKLGGSIFLERVWDKDKIIVGSKLEELTSFRDVFWLLLAAEGTRYDTRC